MSHHAQRMHIPTDRQRAAPVRAATPQPRRNGPQRSALWHALQLKAAQAAAPAPGAPNRSGLPARLKAGVEALSGIAMDDVRVHRNSPEPAKLGAIAFAQGSDIHLAPGQDRHLPHEAWHVVQQKQGRVEANAQLKGGLGLNDDPRLESEADAMGDRASRLEPAAESEMSTAPGSAPRPVAGAQASAPAQRVAETVLPAETGDAGAELDALIGGLEMLALRGEGLGESEAAAKGNQLEDRLAKLRQIASGADQALKRSALFELRRELAPTPLPAGPAGGVPVQRQAVVQRTGIEIAIIIGLGLLAWGLYRLLNSGPTTRLRLVGIQHDAHGSYATVTSEAHLTDVTQRVMYYIKWDANVVPGGNHLGQVPGVASDWRRDLSPNGQPIGSRVNNMGGFFANRDFTVADNVNGLHFYFPDGIQQRILNYGSWWFRLRVLSANGGVLSTDDIEVDWTH